MDKASRKAKTTPFVGIPHYVMQSESYSKLSTQAIEVLNWVLYQFRGSNNGNLVITWDEYSKVLSFGSNNTFRKALKNLTDNELLVISGTGTTNRARGKPPHLYAITWLNVDDCKGSSTRFIGSTRTPYRTSWEQSESAISFRNSIFKAKK